MKKRIFCGSLLALTLLMGSTPACAQEVIPEIHVTQLYQEIQEREGNCSGLPGTRSVGIIQYLVFQLIPENSAGAGTWNQWAALWNNNGYFYSINLNDPNRVIRLRGIYGCANDASIEEQRQRLLNEGWHVKADFVYPNGTTVFVNSTTVLAPEEKEILPKTALVSVEKMSKTRDPINIATGEMLIEATDFAIPGQGPALALARTYRSQTMFSGIFGYGWRSPYDISLEQNASTGSITVYDGHGVGRYFSTDANGSFIPSPGNYATIQNVSDGIFQVTEKDGVTTIFNGGRCSAMTDRNGNTLRVSWDTQAPEGTYIEDAAGRKVLLVLDSAGRVVSAEDPLGRVVSYEYDAAGNLAAITDPAGNVTRYAYDDNHNIVEMTNVNGHKTYFSYDASDRAVENWQDAGVNRVTLDFQGNKTFVTDSMGRQSTYVFNDWGLEVNMTDALGKSTLTSWDNRMQMTQVTDPLNRVTRFAYDDSGNLIWVRDALNQTTNMTYTEDFNLLLNVRDPNGGVTANTYDNRGNLLSTTDPLGAATHMTYDPYGNVMTVTDALNGMTVFEYNSLGQRTGVTDAMGKVSRFAYDTVGNVISATDALGRTTQFAYDVLNRLTRTDFADGTNQTFGYDAFGNRVNATDRKGRVMTSSYDPYERLNSTTDANGGVVSFEYDTEGHLLSLTDQNNQATVFAYDVLGRKASETNAMGKSVSYDYDDVGNIVSRTDGNGQSIAYVYDALNRLIRTDYADGSSVNQSYDTLGRRVRMGDGRGVTVYEYDAAGRLLKVDGPETDDTVQYSYDALGRRTGMTDPSGRVSSYTYDAVGRLTGLTDAAGTTVYAYDAAGNTLSVSYPTGAKITTQYDSMNRPRNVTNMNQTGVVSSFAYTYDAAGLVTKKTYADRSYTEYNYDALDRFIGERRIIFVDVKGSRQSQPKEVFYSSFTYDAGGNRLGWSVNTTIEQFWQNRVPGADEYMRSFLTAAGYGSRRDTRPLAMSKTYSYNAANQMLEFRSNVTVAGSTLPAETVAYEYDDNGNRMKEERVRPSGVNQVTSYGYDQENRLKSLGYTNKPAAAISAAAYEYNGDGLRVKAIEGDTVTKYNYDGTDVLFEKDAAGKILRQYTRAPGYAGGIRGIISMRAEVPVVTGTGKKKTTTYVSKDLYYMYDALGSVVNMVDGAGAVTASYEYDAYGNKINETSTAGNAYQFSSKEWEDHAGLQYFGARYYDPAIGRWLTPDPLGMVDGANVYVYCGNDPGNLIDPFGLLTIIVHGIGRHDRGYSGALGDYLRDQGETVIEYYWSGRLESLGEQNRAAQRIASLLENARRLADKTGEELNVISHSQGTRLAYRAVRNSHVLVNNLVTIASPYAFQYPMPGNVIRWINIWSQADPLSFPSVATAGDDIRITSDHVHYWTENDINLELRAILQGQVLNQGGKER